MTGPRKLKAHGLSFSYGRHPVLSGVSFSLGAGAHVVLGRNGAGKTTLIRLLAGAATAAGGTIKLGEDLLDLRTRSGRALLRHIGWLPQEFGYPPHMKVVDFVAYAAWLKEVPKEQLVSRVEAALEAADMTEQARRPLSALSGGQLRRAGLAAATVADPEVLILDEPTAGLDPEQRDGFHRLILELRKTKVVLIATHLLEDVEALAEHVMVIDAGAILWTGTTDELASTSDGPGGLQGLRQGFRAVLGAAQ
ncbi:ATP-binding cassette domain-containing protein [Glycomyces sp. NPDC046736]|uniref:ATP-binding cassette domain-containing protein n=1 Tax=Glycomyces sp. NPDC046736 TaxID=3155615 RepID=UPI0033D0C59E